MTSVALYWPNLIDYLRIMLAVSAFGCADAYPLTAFILFVVSSILDQTDGWAARKFNQCSRFGAALDMTIDRAVTCGLIMLTGHYYPAFILSFIAMAILDLSSHFFYLYSSFLKGSTSHKNVHSNDVHPNNQSGRNIELVRFYYESRIFMGTLVLCTDLFLLFLFLYCKYPIPLIRQMIIITSPVMIMKQVVHLAQLYQAALDIIEYDNHSRYHPLESCS